MYLLSLLKSDVVYERRLPHVHARVHAVQEGHLCSTGGRRGVIPERTGEFTNSHRTARLESKFAASSQPRGGVSIAGQSVRAVARPLLWHPPAIQTGVATIEVPVVGVPHLHR